MDKFGQGRLLLVQTQVPYRCKAEMGMPMFLEDVVCYLMKNGYELHSKRRVNRGFIFVYHN
jgi:hypothetical protein